MEEFYNFIYTSNATGIHDDVHTTIVVPVTTDDPIAVRLSNRQGHFVLESEGEFRDMLYWKRLQLDFLRQCAILVLYIKTGESLIAHRYTLFFTRILESVNLHASKEARFFVL